MSGAPVLSFREVSVAGAPPYETPLSDCTFDLAAGDLALVDMELLLADLDLVERRLERMAKETGRKAANGDGERTRVLLERCRNHLECEQPLRSLELEPTNTRAVNDVAYTAPVPSRPFRVRPSGTNKANLTLMVGVVADDEPTLQD